MNHAPRPRAAYLASAVAAVPSLSRRLLPVRLEPRVNQRDLRIDRRVAFAFLAPEGLNQLIGALDIGRAVLEGTRRRGWATEALRRRRIFLERHEIGGIGS